MLNCKLKKPINMEIPGFQLVVTLVTHLLDDVYHSRYSLVLYKLIEICEIKYSH